MKSVVVCHSWMNVSSVEGLFQLFLLRCVTGMLVNLFTAESQSVTNATSLFIRASEARERLEVDQKIDHCAVSFIVSVCVYGVARFVKHLTTRLMAWRWIRASLSAQRLASWPWDVVYRAISALLLTLVLKRLHWYWKMCCPAGYFYLCWSDSGSSEHRSDRAFSFVCTFQLSVTFFNQYIILFQQTTVAFWFKTVSFDVIYVVYLHNLHRYSFLFPAVRLIH